MRSRAASTAPRCASARTSAARSSTRTTPRRVGEALLRRYPAFAQGGLAPQAIVLWRKPGADWLYITLLINPGKPAEVCFTASFVAAKISITPVMLKKYFGVVAT